MNNFTFYNPTKLIFGEGKIGKIGEELQAFGIQKVLLLYGKESIFKYGVYEEVKKSLEKANIQWIELGGVKPNPVLSKVQEGIEKMKTEQLQGILAIGGGSVIDSAKAISAGTYYEGELWDLFEGKGNLTKAAPIFTVLTISATGSEMNAGAVITREETHQKWSFGSPLVYPKVSIVDPTIQFTLPANQTVNGAIDAMSHVFELYFDGTSQTQLMDELSEGILRTVMEKVKILLENPKDYAARAELCLSATMALNGMNGMGRNGGDWASHQIEHSISAYYDIPHGVGLAIVFPAWMKYVYQDELDKFERFAERVFHITSGSKEEKALKAIEALEAFYKSIGAPTTLQEIHVPKEALNKLASNAALSAPLGRLKRLQESDILKILQLAYA